MPRNREGGKRPINLSLNAEVLEMARSLGMNVSQTVDELLRAEVMRRVCERWKEDNQAGIAAYNARIEREGTFAQRISRFLAESEAPAATDAR